MTGCAVVLGALLFGYGWMTVELRDRWVARIEVLHPRVVQVMTRLTERADELQRSPRSDDLEDLKREVQRLDFIVEAIVWTHNEAFHRSGHPVKVGSVLGVGAWSFLGRTPGPGDVIINLIHFEGNEYFAYEYMSPAEVNGHPVGFALTFNAAEVRAAWAFEQLQP